MSAIELIDHIYEAAFLPDHWETVCERLSGEVDSFSTSLITIDANQSYRWTCSRSAREAGCAPQTALGKRSHTEPEHS